MDYKYYYVLYLLLENIPKFLATKFWKLSFDKTYVNFQKN